MNHRDYTAEIGLSAGDKIIPWRWLLPILAIVAALSWAGFAWFGSASTPAQADAGSEHANPNS